MADIGTDHGHLPVLLYAEGLCPHVIMTDVNTGPMEKARANWGAAFPEGPAGDFRIGSGLAPLAPGEADAIVIAGMGGILITEILAADAEKACTAKRFILQPRNNSGYLRAWLLDHGYRILREQLAKEGRFFCEILTAEPPAEPYEAAGEDARLSWFGADPARTAGLEYPEAFGGPAEDLARPYLEAMQRKQEKIAAQIREKRAAQGPDAEKAETALAFAEARIVRLAALLAAHKEKDDETDRI